MAHSSETTWGDAGLSIAKASKAALAALGDAEDVYQELNEVYAYAGGTDQLMADLLFSDLIADEQRNPAVASTEEVEKVMDLRAAIQALHQLYQAMNNVATTTADRAALLRRMA